MVHVHCMYVIGMLAQRNNVHTIVWSGYEVFELRIYSIVHIYLSEY